MTASRAISAAGMPNCFQTDQTATSSRMMPEIPAIPNPGMKASRMISPVPMIKLKIIIRLSVNESTAEPPFLMLVQVQYSGGNTGEKG